MHGPLNVKIEFVLHVSSNSSIACDNELH